MNNFFESDDFSVLSMTEAINTLDIVPSKIGSMNLFKGGGITTTTVGVEQFNNELKLIETQPRGTMPEAKRSQKRNLRAIAVPHLPLNDAVMAESIQNVREFGSESNLEAVQATVNAKLAAMKQDHELTHEYHRIGALQGTIKDADGTSTVVDLFTEFGVSRITVNWDTTSITGLKEACISLRRNIESELNLVPYSKIRVMCGEDFWDQLMTRAEVRDAFERYNNNEMARNSNDDAFEYSKIMFEEMRGMVGATPMQPTAEGSAYPITNANIYRRAWAPAPFMETVNTVGKEYYAKQQVMDFNVGVKLHTQSNPLYLVTKPRVLVRLTYST